MSAKKERPADGWPWERSANRRFFVYDPVAGFTYYATQHARDEAAKAIIAGYCDLSDGWDDEVENVIAGEITHAAQKSDVIKRPPDNELDEEGYDEEGYWWGDYKYQCSYVLIPVGGGEG
jgi:hypothetical protein